MNSFLIVLTLGSAIWLALPFLIPSISTGDPFFDLGSQLTFVIQAWIIYGIVRFVSVIRNRRKAKKLKSFA